MRHTRSQVDLRSYKPKKNFLGGSKKRHKQIAQHDERSYYNPYHKAKKFVFPSIPITKILLPILFLVWFGLILYLPYFRITNFTYNGLKTIKAGDITAILDQELINKRRLWPANNYFLTSESRLSTILANDFSLNTVQVKKIFPNTLDITVQEKISSAIYDNGEAYFLLDANGEALEYLRATTSTEFMSVSSTAEQLTDQLTMASEASSSDLTTSSTIMSTGTSTIPTMILEHVPDVVELTKDFGQFPIIYDMGNKGSVQVKQIVLPSPFVQGIINLYNGLQQTKLAGVKYIIVTDPLAGVTVVTNKPWKLLFQPTNDIKAQLQNAAVVLQNNKPTQYIDLRFGSRVFWK